eukprot:PhF_6_TR1567/c0_g1_i1/m.2855
MDPEEIEKCIDNVRISSEEMKSIASTYYDFLPLNDVKSVQNAILHLLGNPPTETELLEYFQSFKYAPGPVLEFRCFVQIIFSLKKKYVREMLTMTDTMQAFIALGGDPSPTSSINATDLSETVKNFKLTIDIDALISKADKNHTGVLEMDEFEEILAEESDDESVDAPDRNEIMSQPKAQLIASSSSVIGQSKPRRGSHANLLAQASITSSNSAPRFSYVSPESNLTKLTNMFPSLNFLDSSVPMLVSQFIPDGRKKAGTSKKQSIAELRASVTEPRKLPPLVKAHRRQTFLRNDNARCAQLTQRQLGATTPSWMVQYDRFIHSAGR